MSGHGAKLAVSFAVSLVLHGAALWAVAARVEPRQAKPQSEVEILDRELFFRHAPARQVERTAPVAVSERLSAHDTLSALEPNASTEAIAPAAAEEARQHTPERRMSPTSDADAAPTVSAEAIRPVQQQSARIEPDKEATVARAVEAEAARAVAPPDDRLSPLGGEEQVRPAHADERLVTAASEQRLARAEPNPEAAAAAVDRLRPAAPDRRAIGDRETPQIRPAEPRDTLTTATSEQRLARAESAPAAEPVESADRLAAAAPGDRVRPAEREVPQAPSVRPGETTAVASAEQRLARAEASREAVRSEAFDVLASVPAAPAETGIAAMRQPETVPPASVQPRRAVAAPQPESRRQTPAEAGETAEPIRDSLATATPTAPIAAPVEPEPSEGAIVVARRLAPDTPSDKAMVLVGKPVEAATRRILEPGQAQRAAPAPAVVASRTSADRIEPQAATGTVGGSGSGHPARPVTPRSLEATPPAIAPAPAREPVNAAAQPHAPERIAALQSAEPVDTGPAPTVAPASEATATPAQPRAPERLAALMPGRSVESGARTTVPPTGSSARVPRVRAETAAPSRLNATGVQRMARAEPQADTPAVERAPTLAPVTAVPETRTPAAATPQRLAASDPAERFTRTYKGGDCFFAVRTASAEIASAEDAQIVSYGARLESVLAFKEAFEREFNIEPSLGWESVTDAQCTGISFARVVLGNRAPSLAIRLDSKQIESGSALSGHLAEDSLAHLAMLLVDDDGLVHNISDFLRQGDDGIEFFIPQVHAIRDGKRRVHLLMAISASAMLPALDSREAIHSDDFFSQLLEQAREADAKLELGLDHFVIF